ncbi:MAG: aldo/keto reductase [Fusobacteriota bacterium]
MLYRTLGNEKVSILGFGCMRFPEINGEIDEEKSMKMIRYAIDNGINYIDTAYPYHGGKSEPFVAKALSDGYRDKVHLATKLPVWLCKKEEDFDKYLNEQLNNLNTDHIDFYMLHAMNKKRWEKLKKLNIFDFLERAKKEGKIKYFGFSFHDDLDVFKDIIDGYDWSFCQIQYNYLDEYNQAGKEGLEYAKSKGIDVIVMEPLRGGKLAVNPPKKVKDILNDFNENRTPVEWALKWVWNHSEVSLLLSGMSTMEQVKENIKLADSGKINNLNKKEIDVINQVKETYNNLKQVDCTKCNYCMPCPVGVDIPKNFEIYNDAYKFNRIEENIKRYNDLKDTEKASNCIKCGKCEESCPQQIEIREKLEKVAELFGN